MRRATSTQITVYLIKESFMKTLTIILATLALSSSAFALTPKSEIIGKQYISADKACSVVIDQDEYWKADCDHLKKKYRQTILTGHGIDVVSCYGDPTCEGVVFKGQFSRPLQAFIIKDAQLPGGLGLGIVYGSPADGDVEVLVQH